MSVSRLHYITLHYISQKSLHLGVYSQKSLHLGVYTKIFTLGSVYITYFLKNLYTWECMGIVNDDHVTCMYR